MPSSWDVPPSHSALLEALPEQFESSVLAGDHASLAVFHGDEIETVVAWELEPTDVVGALAARNKIVFQMVSDGSRLGIDGVGAEIGRVAVEGSCFFIESCAEQSFRKWRRGFAIRPDDDLDGYMAEESYMSRPVGRS